MRVESENEDEKLVLNQRPLDPRKDHLPLCHHRCSRKADTWSISRKENFMLNKFLVDCSSQKWMPWPQVRPSRLVTCKNPDLYLSLSCSRFISISLYLSSSLFLSLSMSFSLLLYFNLFVSLSFVLSFFLFASSVSLSLVLTSYYWYCFFLFISFSSSHSSSTTNWLRSEKIGSDRVFNSADSGSNLCTSD